MRVPAPPGAGSGCESRRRKEPGGQPPPLDPVEPGRWDKGSMQVQEGICLYEVGGNFVISPCFPFNLNRI